MSPVQVLDCETIRDVDRYAIEELKIPGLVLMENAGRGIADLIVAASSPSRVVIACGAGNNGGDGYVVARHLDLHGFQVHVLRTASESRLRGDAAANYRWLAESNVHIHNAETGWPASARIDWSQCSWAVDALLGTGVHGNPRAPLDHIIAQLNELPCQRLAVDIPSGLDSVHGTASPNTFRAHVTGTFVAAKPGLVTPSAAEFVGQLHVLQIGVPRNTLKRFGAV
jgi:NAD(P)H-hydrate epimerase